MDKLKTYETKYGTFYDELNEDDIKYYEMTDDEYDEIVNRVANKTLNGIRDAEVIAVEARWYRTKVLRFGETIAKQKKIDMDMIFDVSE